MNRLVSVVAALLLITVITSPAGAAEDTVYTITIKNHRFEPAEITIPAGKKVKLVVRNMDPTPEEFESHELNREKVIAGNTEGVLFIGPLAPGNYPFVGEFHEDTAKGRIVVK